MQHPKFEKITFRPNEEWPQIPGQNPYEMEVSRDIISGFFVHMIEDSNHQPPMTAVFRAIGECTFGNVSPTLILSSERIKRKMLRILKPDHVRPVFHQFHLGFLLQDAKWIDEESLDETLWVAILNEQRPKDPRFNGCYKFKME